tara:strand:- start:3402 stop:4169 length:768 start_codon:yes stop_codon:yes gene_type:complete
MLNIGQSIVQDYIQHLPDNIIFTDYIQDVSVVSESLLGVSSSLFLGSNLKNRLNIESNITRKVIHVFSGPLYLESWKFYSDTPIGHYFSTIVPIFILIGLYLNKNKDIGSLISRDSKELNITSNIGLSSGPFIYINVLLILNLIGWKDIHSILAIANMAYGDGFSDIIGRRYGKRKWNFNKSKSLVGSCAFFWFSILGSLIHLNSYNYDIDFKLLSTIILHSGIVSFIEIIPFGDDNINVPLSSYLLSHMLFTDI